jgi:hypothetical protein
VVAGLRANPAGHFARMLISAGHTGISRGESLCATCAVRLILVSRWACPPKHRHSSSGGWGRAAMPSLGARGMEVSMSNANHRTSATAIAKTEAYSLGWLDYQTGFDSSKQLAKQYASAKADGNMLRANDLSAMKYAYGRLSAALAEREGIKLGVPNSHNIQQHVKLLRQVTENQDAPSTTAVIAHRVATALQEICGTIRPRAPLATLTFRHGWPIVPTLADLQSR